MKCLLALHRTSSCAYKLQEIMLLEGVAMRLGTGHNAGKGRCHAHGFCCSIPAAPLQAKQTNTEGCVNQV